MSTEQEPVIVYTGTIAEADVLKGLLEVNGIPAFLQGETMASLAAWYVAPAGVRPIKVLVAGENAEEAKLIVEDFVDRQEAEPPPEGEMQPDA